MQEILFLILNFECLEVNVSWMEKREERKGQLMHQMTDHNNGSTLSIDILRKTSTLSALEWK